MEVYRSKIGYGTMFLGQDGICYHLDFGGADGGAGAD